MNMNDLKLAMGERIRLARESKHLSRAQLAELVHLSTKFIFDIENGAKGMSLKNFILITQALDTPADYLLFGSMQSPPSELCSEPNPDQK